MLRSARDENAEQRKITASAILTSRKRRRRGPKAVAAAIADHQWDSIALSVGSTVDQLAEQGIDAPPVGQMSASALVTPEWGVVALLGRAATDAAFDQLVQSLVIQSSLTANLVDLVRRTDIKRYVRVLTPPSCSRCAILAGKKFDWRADFNRHPRCDCTALLTTDENATHLVTDPLAAFRAGQIRGLSKADTWAVEHGADLNQVVNVRSQKAGLQVGSSVMVRHVPAYRLHGEQFVWDRMTPEAIRRISATREEAIQRLADNGYIRGLDGSLLPTKFGKAHAVASNGNGPERITVRGTAPSSTNKAPAAKAGTGGGSSKPPIGPYRPLAGEPGPEDRDYWDRRQEAAGIPVTTEELQPHEVKFVERFVAAGQTFRWIRPGSYGLTEDRARIKATHDFFWDQYDGFYEHKGVRADYDAIHGRIVLAASKAAKSQVRKDRFIIDIGDDELTDGLRRQLEEFNLGRRKYRLLDLWVMSGGRLIQIGLRNER